MNDKLTIFICVLGICIFAASLSYVAVYRPFHEAPPISDWHVTLVSPNGEIVDSWDIKCHGKPLQRYFDNYSALDDVHTPAKHDWYYTIRAPEGWLLQSEKVR